MGLVLYVGLPFILLLSGLPIYLVLLGTALAGALVSTSLPLSSLHTTLFGSLDSFPILAIPLFVLAGEIMGHGGMGMLSGLMCSIIQCSP